MHIRTNPKVRSNPKGLPFYEVTQCNIKRTQNKRKGYIYGAVKGHRDAMFMAAVQWPDAAKPNTNPNTD